jgi:hypothetical protein
MSADQLAHGHSCDHGDHHERHGGGGHSHSLSVDADRRYLTIALLLILGFMVFEVVAGIIAHSLALLSDAASESSTRPCKSITRRTRCCRSPVNDHRMLNSAQ